MGWWGRRRGFMCLSGGRGWGVEVVEGEMATGLVSARTR